MDWLTIAKSLPYEGKRKIKHCALDASMLVSHGQKGYSAYCFRCGPVGFEPHGVLSIAQVLERRKATEELRTSGVVMPRDFSLDIPAPARLWLQKAGITAATAEFYGIGYSKYVNRVIVPVWEDMQLVAVIARRIDKVGPKYVAKMRGSNEYFTSAADPTEAATVVVTEDVLSSIRCGAVYRSYALLGTSTGAASIAGLSSRLEGMADVPPAIAVWLDPDRAGRTASRKLARALRVAGWDAYEVRSERDPKYYSNANIKEFVEGARHHTPKGDEDTEGLL
jgi:hypothetical protein